MTKEESELRLKQLFRMTKIYQQCNPTDKLPCKSRGQAAADSYIEAGVGAIHFFDGRTGYRLRVDGDPLMHVEGIRGILATIIDAELVAAESRAAYPSFYAKQPIHVERSHSRGTVLASVFSSSVATLGEWGKDQLARTIDAERSAAAKEEREECAKVAESAADLEYRYEGKTNLAHGHAAGCCKSVAAAIRCRPH